MMGPVTANTLAPNRIGTWEEDVLLELKGVATKWQVWCVDEVSSTMDYARIVLPQIDGDSLGLILAQSQTRGRGRQSRTWESTEGSLFLTLVLQTAGIGPHLSGFSLCAGVAIRRVCENLGAGAQLKWPNDILSAEGKKLGGVLIENCSHDGRVAVLVGIGLNLLQKPQAIEGTSSLYELCGQAHEAPVVAGKLAREFSEVWPAFQAGGFAQFQAEWMKHCLALGKEVTVKESGREVSGVLKGVDTDGTLLLNQDGKELRVVVGDVVIGTV